MVRKRACGVGVVWLVAALLGAGAGCGGSNTGASGAWPGSGGGYGGERGSPGEPDAGWFAADAGTSPPAATGPWTELAPSIVAQGGVAPSPGGRGHDGGMVHLVSTGNITLDPSLPGIAAADVQAATAGAMVLGATDLVADVASAGSVRIDGQVVAGGADAVRTVTAGGDLFVSGTLRSADLGPSRQGITLSAGGTVFVTGTVDASGAPETGQAGGAIRILARRVVVTGALLTSGGDVAGGSGGPGGDVVLRVGGDVWLGGTLRTRGGAAIGAAADASGGAAGSVRIDADGAVRVAGVVDARGGLATAAAAGVAVAGGPAGSVLVGESAPPTEIAILVPVAATGGPGGAAGGKGGTVTLEPDTGTVIIAGANAIDASGGDSLAAPGAGGLVHASPRRDPGAGGVRVTGQIWIVGGSVAAGGAGNGGDAGTLELEMVPTDGPVDIDEPAMITVDGGRAGGPGVGGGGGHVFVYTKDGDLTVAGHISARGGRGTDPGGTGGLGGMVYFFSDDNHNSRDNDRGNLLIAPSGVVDASGGDGATGGSARSDGARGSVPTFPDHQEQIAIFLNCDGVHGNSHNWLDNRGRLVARGGAAGGNGGDIVYHGIAPSGNTLPDSGNYSPPSGNIDIAGDGAGAAGDYRGE